jgi:hypothetical protein
VTFYERNQLPKVGIVGLVEGNVTRYKEFENAVHYFIFSDPLLLTVTVLEELIHEAGILAFDFKIWPATFQMTYHVSGNIRFFSICLPFSELFTNQ